MESAMRRATVLLGLCVFVVAGSIGCSEKEKKCEEEGTRVRVRAPYTNVDVFVPKGREEDTRVDVDVDD
jgi:5-deoxy-D-glucuronate isomerase